MYYVSAPFIEFESNFVYDTPASDEASLKQHLTHCSAMKHAYIDCI